MYELRDYGSMIGDRLRMDAYAYALKSVVKPHSVVLDIGTATGIHALLASKFGSRQVYALEPQETIKLAEELARENGFDDRITFIQDISTAVTLPEKVDVIVSDLRGLLPLFQNHIPSIVDARRRHLAPGGVLIPQRDTLWAAVVEARTPYNELVRPWTTPYGLSMEAARKLALNSWSDENSDLIERRHLLSEPQLIAVLDYTTIEDSDLQSNFTVEATRAVTAHGLLLWFDTILTGEIGFSNGPGQKKMADVYGRGFFPLLEPVVVAPGDVIELAIRAELAGGSYEWSWHTRFYSGDKDGRLRADFRQSTAVDSLSL